ncbi:MAG TPA: DUF1080 domain-containing protein, partial [Bryobacteraceae bacterium]|nr:DUF1080 domain-containing protein [Bryobacteraceae bacterium]
GVLLLCTALMAADQPERGFKTLFDGKSLKGWEGDSRLWSVVEGTIRGTTEGVDLKQNTFLVYKPKTFGDFILRAQVKLRNGNSGIQVRSEALPEHVVKGLQADMAENAWWGSVYDEKGTRGVMVNGWKGKAEKVVKADDWNDVEVRCQGEDVRVTVNGMVTAELKDASKTEGILALQLHRGPPMEVRFRNIRIQELKGEKR